MYLWVYNYLMKNIRYIVGVLMVILITVSIDAIAQSDDISLYGVVRDHADNKKIPNVDIIVYENGSKIFDRKTNLNGKYDFVLDFDKFYKIVYNYPNYVSKFLTIDVRDIPEVDRKGGFEMNIDMTLFKEVEGLDVSLLDDPIGKAQFDPKRGEMAWDMAYTNMMQKKIRDLMRKHDEKVEQVEAEKDKMQDEFRNLVRLGDAGMKNRDYDSSVGYYTQALTIKTDDEEVIQKLKDAKSAAAEMAAIKEKQARYDGFIKQADSFFNKSDWSNAMTQYQSASKLFPEEEYPQIRIKTINEKLDAERNHAKLEAQIMALLKEGDRLVAIEEYDGGIGKYEEVLSLDPNNSDAKRKLVNARRKRDEWLKNQENQAQYDELITQADKLFDEKNYSNAIKKYRSSTLIKPAETYPQEQISKAEELLSLAKAEEAKLKSFQELVEKGDAKISETEYQAGIDFYNQALGIFSDDKAVKSKITDAKAKIAAELAAEEAARKQKELDEEFAGLVVQGDNSFDLTNYDDAIGFYQQALKIKKGDAEVEAKIDRARKAINNLLEEKQLDEQYAEVIRKADKEFNGHRYDAAKEFYNQALSIKEGEEYPQNKLLEIDQILASIAADEAAAKQKAIDDEFNALVIKGDEFVRNEDYSPGIESYKQALIIKPGEAEVQAKIDDALAKQKDKMASLAVDEQYAALIKDADKLFNSKSWEPAKNLYNEAYQVKNEQYPLDKINEIDLKIAALAEAERKNAEAEKQAEFEKLERKGDDAVELSNYADGIRSYEEALVIFPDNQRVIDKKRNAENLLADYNSKNELDGQYNDLIANADSEFNAKSYANARAVYQQAINLKPDEQYPKNRIDEIDLLLLEMEKRNAENEKSDLFAQLETEGDEKVEVESYSEAIDKYDQALEIYPEDARVQQKAGKARQLLKTAKSAAELDAMYDDFIAKADALFISKDYLDARRDYQQAFALKPEAYPKNQIGEIDRLLLEMERKDVEEEAARLAQMRKKESDKSWDENTTEVEKYIVEAKNNRDESESMKYEELLAYKESLRNTQSDYQEAGDNNRVSNASLVNEEKNVGGQLYDMTKLEDDQRRIAEVAMVKEMDKRWVIEKDNNQRERAKSSNQTEEYLKYRKKLQEKHYELIKSNYDNSKKAEQIRYKKYEERMDIRQKNIDEVNREKNGIKEYFEDKNSKQQKHINNEIEYTKAVKGTQNADLEDGNDLSAMNFKNLESEKELREMETNAWKKKADLKRSVEFDDVKRMKWPSEKKPYDYYPQEKAKSYQQGVTEEISDEGNNKVVRRMVVYGNKVDEYKMVVTNHGTYYFKNGDSISKNTWNTNTENVDISD